MLGKDAVTGDGLRHEIVAAAIRYYAAHPRERAGIGSTEGHQRMLAAIGVEPPAAPGDRPTTGRRLALLVGATVLAIPCLTLIEVGGDDLFGADSAAGMAVHLVVVMVVSIIAALLRDGIGRYRQGRRR
ncbi:hypothetical protein [Actinoplanes regularis]|uniref:Uncharacterized protein n=1 Tax=Actinoplanes regularis TaxID=52697 RepID=A0A239A8S8_9ACTN|nr:hypothetical protein [Actinoplanes regularis]GIE87009.1 hypothetical protein Are01nite_34890 [Actinoplanes regularis]SNR92035.1 hypothetical protein SAMN06264365_107154 [Actinoplanes regularis]